MRATFSSYPLDLIALLTFDEAPHCAVFFIVLLFALISVQTLSSACPQTSESASLPEGARLYPVFGRNVLEKETREWKFGNSRKCKNNDGNMMRDEPCRPARAYPPPSPGPYSHRDAYVFTTNTSHPAVVQCVPSSLRAVLQGQLHKRVCLLFKPGVGTHKAIFFCRWVEYKVACISAHLDSKVTSHFPHFFFLARCLDVNTLFGDQLDKLKQAFIYYNC
jgi:hypothetical protein